jgi:hypothetical protein
MNFWWCNQTSGWPDEYKAGVVCAKDNTNQTQFRESVLQARKGDIVLHYRSRKGVVAVSRAKEDAVECWRQDAICLYGRGWAFSTEYHLFARPIPLDSFIDVLATVPMIDGPVQTTGSGENRIWQRYFMPFHKRGLEVVYRASTDRNWPSWAVTMFGP